MKSFFTLSLLIFLNTISFSQEKETIAVKAGHSLLDYFTVSERYLYPEFTRGHAVMKTGVYSEREFNYNFLSGEMDFIQNSDTMEISNSIDIKFIVIAQDTFYYDKGYILQIKNSIPKIGLKERIEFKEILKKDPYGVRSQGEASTAYNAIASDANYYKLKANHDIIFERSRTYYISTHKSGYIVYSKKNVFKLFPKQNEKIKSFVKSNKIDFDIEEDLFRLAEYIEKL